MLIDHIVTGYYFIANASLVKQMNQNVFLEKQLCKLRIRRQLYNNNFINPNNHVITNVVNI